MTIRHFLTLRDLSTPELNALTQRAAELREMQHNGELYQPFKGKVLAMIFEKSSTRTRVSFETGMAQFGGHALFLSPRDTQLGRGEPLSDTSKVISSMVDIIMIRTFGHELVETFAENSSVPVINALTDSFHPCQLLADVQTYEQHRGSIVGKTVTYVGDGNNMCHSYINAAVQFGFHLNIACPKGYEPDAEILKSAGDAVTLMHDTLSACEGVDLVTTDVWASMGQEDEQKKREVAFANFQVNDKVMSAADKDGLFMHCLPAHREEEVTASVIDGHQSVVWDQAENRLHAQKALLEFLLKR
ncbi:MAG TPA: ornithine carbamoyltransferase [Ectothiorhodospiraceae bacterium]|nr:ornithine carbamoyltransferase [Ectothiorhodospiraceae bacterium]